MNCYSTMDRNQRVSFREAVMNGIAPDGGLYMPIALDPFKKDFFKSLPTMDLQEIAYNVAERFVDGLSKNDLQSVVEKTFTFDAPVIDLSENLAVMELFHGPTLAFKDFGARFLANLVEYYNRGEDREIVILVATSGDTGSAVAHGFYGSEHIKVLLLYPSGMVSHIQEQQLTTLDKNIFACEVQGDFDDCQRLVKTAFLDDDLRRRYVLSSANSINIARLLPQSFYYFNAFARALPGSPINNFTVPSGNFGNLTAGLLAKRLGLPVDRFVAAVNQNDVFYKFMDSGNFNPAPTRKSLSNAMDVGNPSNFSRIWELYNGDHAAMAADIVSLSISDEETLETISRVYESDGYILDPHGAVGYAATLKLKREKKIHGRTIMLETAHPSKFIDVLPEPIAAEVNIPERLQIALDKPKKALLISADFDQFKENIFEILK